MNTWLAFLVVTASALALALAGGAKANHDAGPQRTSLAWPNTDGPGDTIGTQKRTRIAQSGRGCGHGPGNSCRRSQYPPEQVADPGWCDSHFVVDKKGV
jgi:hypothetical protein